MPGRYVEIFRCFKCGRVYAGKHYDKLNNIYPIASEDNKCTWINNFYERSKYPDFQVAFCDDKLKYMGKVMLPGHREFFQKDECLDYYTKRSMKELCS